MLWAYRTTLHIPTEETPFKLTFSTEAITPLDIRLPTLWIENFDSQQNEGQLQANLDLIEEAREWASIRMAAYRQRVARYYNSWVKAKIFELGELALRRIEASQPTKVGK